MEQKEADNRTVSRTNSTTELEEEITGPQGRTGEEADPEASNLDDTVATSLAPEVPGEDAAPEAEPDQEQAQALLPLASGVGRRLKRRRTNAPLKVKEPDEDAAGKLAHPHDPEDYPLSAWRARTPDNRGLGRGGLAAVVLLVIFVPTFFFFLYLLYSNTERIDAIRQNLADFNESGAVAAASGTVSAENSLVQLLNRAGTQMYPLKVENLSPSGRVVFYTDNNTLAFTYGNLDPLDADQVYTIWLASKPAGSADATYIRLANLPNNHTNAGTTLVNQGALPANFKLANYAEISVTVEKVDQKNDKPSGPRAFSLDLTQRKS
ncbi:MAG: anti-sigma factor [Chloroflexi bacterium]|nr:anti-sigma factor [Chloroflexota bacterium]OJV98314.1 MAG: hypothetical protein BGO39_16170 [Chloroflexi bacterium 54-19]